MWLHIMLLCSLISRIYIQVPSSALQPGAFRFVDPCVSCVETDSRVMENRFSKLMLIRRGGGLGHEKVACAHFASCHIPGDLRCRYGVRKGRGVKASL